jgi:type I protein arginine methyltransferase
MYSVVDYGRMIADRVRMDAHTEALRRAIRPNSVVLDIGTGTGIFAFIACQLGARRVYAVESSDVIALARMSADANGFADRITFIQGLSTEISLPERADIVVSDLRSVLPYFRHHLPAIIDARTRLLAPHGTLTPKKDVLWAAVVEAPELYDRNIGSWDENGYGLDLQAPRNLAVNTLLYHRFTAEQLLTAAQSWATIDYSTVEDANVSADNVAWQISRAGIGHGIALWFETELAEGVRFTSGPTADPSAPNSWVYGNMFLPWSRPVQLAAGTRVTCALRAHLVGEDYVWQWQTQVFEHDNEHRPHATFRQSDMLSGMPRSKGLTAQAGRRL